MTIIIYLAFLSQIKGMQSNPFLYLVSHKIWKNSAAILHSSLYIIFESCYNEEYLEVLFWL